jgi:hypothetical protein
VPEKPAPSDKKRRDLIVRVVFLVVCVASAYGFAALRFQHNARFVGASLERLTEGTALLPYQFRVLIPWLVECISNLPLVDLPLDSIYFLVEVTSLFLAILAFRHYLALPLGNSILPFVLSITLLYPLTIQYLVWDPYPIFYYPYDIPAVLFLTLGLIFLYEKSWTKYYVLFIVATFNRETSCFFTIVFLITSFGKESPSKLAAHTLFQLTIWVAVKGLLYLVFSTNASAPNSVWGVFDDNISFNMHRLSSPTAYLSLLSIVGFLWLPTLLLSPLIRDEFVRRSLLVCLPFFVGMLLVGNIVETRIFGELTPIVFSGFLLIARELVLIARHRMGLVRDP